MKPATFQAVPGLLMGLTVSSALYSFQHQGKIGHGLLQGLRRRTAGVHVWSIFSLTLLQYSNAQSPCNVVHLLLVRDEPVTKWKCLRC